MKNYRVIIPSWAALSLDMQAETGTKYPAFLQLSGQPLYSHIINLYEKIKNEAEFVVVLSPDAPSLQAIHLTGFDVKTVRLSNSSNIGDTVLAGMCGLGSDQKIIIHMADTLISPHDFGFEENVLYVQLRTDLYRWTSVRKENDGRVRVVTDRDQLSSGIELMVCVGVLMCSDSQKFHNALEAALKKPVDGIDPFFIAVEEYSEKYTISFRRPKYWYDYGHIDSYYESRLSHNNIRHFNVLTYDSELGLVTKRSQNTESFRHQVRWFKQVPDDLNSFLPRIYDSSDGPNPHITMELLSIPTLGDLFVSSRLELGAWNDVARKINSIQLMLGKYEFKSPVAKQIASEVYISKTVNRILLFCKQRPEALEMWVNIEGKKFGLKDVLETIQEYALKTKILSLEKLTPIHGDLCFSNIMYDPRGRHIKLIDPRGEFGVPGIYGDPRYDKAKLMHSYGGGYDFIVSDNFDVKLSKNGKLECSILKNDYHDKVNQIFNSGIFSNNEERLQCEAIQALLFLSMLPLHSDKPERQLAMLTIGLYLYGARLLDRRDV
jgi:hypothetical protein